MGLSQEVEGLRTLARQQARRAESNNQPELASYLWSKSRGYNRIIIALAASAIAAAVTLS